MMLSTSRMMAPATARRCLTKRRKIRWRGVSRWASSASLISLFVASVAEAVIRLSHPRVGPMNSGCADRHSVQNIGQQVAHQDKERTDQRRAHQHGIVTGIDRS